MSFHADLFYLRRNLQDNPAILILAGCGLAAAVFLGLVIGGRQFRRLRRWLRALKRKSG